MKEKKYQNEDRHQLPDMNFFRGNYSGNKITDKDNYFFSSRAKDDVIKTKPRLLTGRLPDAFNVQGQRKESAGEREKRINGNDSIDQKKRYATEGNIQYKSNKFQKQNINLVNPFSADNSDSEKAPFVSSHQSSLLRANTQSNLIDNDKMVINKPVYLRGSSANCHKKQTINNKIILDPTKDNTQVKANTIQNYLSAIKISKTHTFLPKLSIDELDMKLLLNNRLNDNNNSNQFALVEGFTYHSNNVLKHYFHVPSLQLYILKEIKYHNTLIDQIQSWKKQIEGNSNFLQIHQHFVNNPEGCISLLIEYPFGFSLYEIINSTGIASSFFMNKIARNCLSILSSYNKVNNNKDYGIYCQCDLYYNSNGEMKILPIVGKVDQADNTNLCECKKFLFKLSKVFYVPITQFFSLGFILLKCLVGNIQLKVFELLFTQSKPKLECCLMHTLLSIEDFYLSSKDNALLSHFINLLPNNFLQFLCELLSFGSNSKPNFKNTWLNSIAKQQRIYLRMNEFLKIVHEEYLNKSYITRFINNFNIVFTNLGVTRNIDDFLSEFKSKRREIDAICKLYDIDINYLISKLKESVKHIG